MPLFKRSPRATSTTKHNIRGGSTSPERKGIFSSNHRTKGSATNTRARSSSPASDPLNRSNSERTHRSGLGIFGHRLRNRSRSIDHDPGIIGAREKVSEAEQAEKDADRALMEARKHVQLARDHVRTLEEEAVKDIRMAKLKQAEAKVIQKSAKSLGRHGP